LMAGNPNCALLHRCLLKKTTYVKDAIVALLSQVKEFVKTMTFPEFVKKHTAAC